MLSVSLKWNEEEVVKILSDSDNKNGLNPIDTTDDV